MASSPTDCEVKLLSTRGMNKIRNNTPRQKYRTGKTVSNAFNNYKGKKWSAYIGDTEGR